MLNEVVTHFIADFVCNYNVYITHFNQQRDDWLKAGLF